MSCQISLIIYAVTEKGKKSMRDEEIIEALELCCTQDGQIPCYDCPCWDDGVQKCEGLNHTDLLGLINRQKAEIEALKKVVLDDYATEYDNKIKSEAVKEFADRLKMNITINNTNDGYLDYSVDYHCLMEDIDDLVKEMVGDKK